MPTTPFLPGPDSVGEEYVLLTPGAIGGANRLLGASPFTAGGVTNIPLPSAGCLAAIKDAELLFAGTVPVGTVLLTGVIRKRQVGGAFVTVSTTVTLNGRTQWDRVALRQAAGTTLRDVTLAAGEVFVFTVDNTGGAMTTQPVDLLLTVRAAVLR